MKFDDLLTFSYIDGIGEKTLKKLHDIESVTDLFTFDDKELSKYLPSKKIITEFRTKFDDYREIMHSSRKKLAEDGALILSTDNSQYPERLLNSESFPVFLYCIGNISLINHPQSAAISGSRQATPDGLETAFNTAKSLAKKDVVVISGLARGIDTAAHNGAYPYGKTIAVLPFYSPVYPPDNKKLCEKILTYGGLVICEHFYQSNIKFQLLNRDKIIVNLSDKLYIPDSYTADSGTAYTVDYARSRKKTIYSYCCGKYVMLREEP